jgi:hypothetical protein
MNYAFLHVDLDSPHSGKVDDHSAVTHSESSGAMSTTTHRQRQPLMSAKIESPCNVIGVGAAHDYCRMPIVGVIVNLACRLIVRSVRRNDMAANLRGQLPDCTGIDRQWPLSTVFGALRCHGQLEREPIQGTRGERYLLNELSSSD